MENEQPENPVLSLRLTHSERQFPDTSFHKKEVLIISILTIDSAYGISLLFSDLFYVSPIISSI